MAKVLMVVAQKDFKDEELLVPKEVLEAEGHKITIASLSRGKATGVGGTEIQPDLAVHEVNPDFFEAIVLVGGPGSPILARTEDVLNLVKKASEKNKVVAAICLAPMALANAGVLSEKNATVFPTNESVQALKNGGATYKEEPVVTDGKIVTADSPASAGKFGSAIAELLK